ncbi:GNAT family N-acetyltransferase [Asticcacaulis sp. AND118]|uniref:GNAT family N-acetyltransferase n=1 Tax=Asticcacaulis sp. AND118 TaxID=2840468 RepID=UPI001CFF97D9|nr:GNAT family N-acetyltransferase [Asticcacaulis sp. AND118]UDF03871.1 GNAT family N-acetyltransferase [Asticcacaulis sp. AND118]
MTTCDLISPRDLSETDIAAWRDMAKQTFAFGSPVLSWDFCAAVAQVRDDVKVAVYRKGGKVVAILPHHRRPGAFARPVGAPFNDYTALISFPDTAFPAREALALAGIRAFQVTGLIDPYGAFDGFEGEPEDAYGIDLTHGETVNNVEKKHLKNINRLRRRLEEEHGEVRFEVPDFTPENFEAMLAIKRAQTAQTGIHDFLSAPWVQALMRNLFVKPANLDTQLYGHLTTVTAGGKPIIWHFGPRLGDRVHPWVSAFDAAYGAYSPGQIFLQGCQTPLRELGVTYYDLSTGQQHYKNAFCNTHSVVRHGRLYAASGEGRTSETLSRLMARSGKALGVSHLTQRLGRRLDHLASLELDLGSRVNGTIYAFANARKRLSQ